MASSHITQSFDTMLGVEQARERIRTIAAEHASAKEHVELADSFGRTLAEDVVAPFDVPGYVNSAMDGFAVRAADLSADGDTTLTLAGEIFAGGDDIPRVSPGTCVRITTGAPLALDADTVVMKENTRLDGDRVVIAVGTAPGANVRPAGEDYANGDAALKRGDVLTPARVAVLASFGFTRVSVAAKPGTVLFTTGDELIEPGKPLGFGKIYDSNRFSAGGLIEQHGGRLMRHERLRDDPAAVADALVRAGNDADIIVSSGGVSAGEADYLPRILGEVGKVYFWKVKIKPGMPFLFGRVGRALMFALPGNPVSGIATFLTLVAPAFAVMQGRVDTSLRLSARLTESVSKRHPRAEFQRARIECDANGQLLATPLRKQGSGMLRGAADADALIVLPEGTRDFATGDVVSFLPMPGWASGV